MSISAITGRRLRWTDASAAPGFRAALARLMAGQITFLVGT